MSYMPSLNVQDVVNVQISLSAVAQGYRNFGAALCLGSSAVIDVNERMRFYTQISNVAGDFGTTAPEYLWANEFFAQSPQPNLLYIGRFAQTPTSAVLHGAGLTPLQQLIANFTAVTSGSMYIAVDGVPYALTGLNFSACTNLNGVASVLQTALQNAGAANARVIWGAGNNRFDIVSGSTGTVSTISYAASPTAIGNFVFSANPVNNSVLTPGGTIVTFVTATPTGSQVQIGSSLAVTLASLLTYLNASSDTNLVKFRYSTNGTTTLYLASAATGTAGNSLTISAGSSPASNAVASGATLSGGSGTDVSVLLGLSLTPTNTGSNANPPVNGIVAETALSCIETFDAMSGAWYAASFAPQTPLAVSDHVAVAGYIESAGRPRIYLISSQNTAAYDSTRSDDIGSILQAAGYARTLVEYSSSNPYCVASLFGRFATVNYAGSNTTITGKFKQQPGVVAEYLTENQAATLKAKNYNVYAMYQNGSAITQEAVMASGIFIDSRINADAWANYTQTDVFNLLLTTQTKTPQTDEGMNLIGNQIAATSQKFVTNGYLAPGTWNTTGFGALTYGQFLPLGFYIYIPPVASQSETDRAARKSVLFQVAGKEAGAVHTAYIVMTVNP